MSKSNTGNHGIPDSKWRIRPSDEIPPIAFSVPVDDEALQGAPSEVEECRDYVADYVKAQSGARYFKKVAELGAIRDSNASCLQTLEAEFARRSKEIGDTELELMSTKVCLPSGWLLKLCFLALVLLGTAVALSEWINAAGFVARRETHDFAMALSFTVVIAIAALALKLPLATCRPQLIRGLSALFYVGGLVAGVLFFWQMAQVYIAPEPSLNDLIAATEIHESNLTPDKRWLFLCQVGVGIAAGISFVAAAARQLQRVQRTSPNPIFVTRKREITALQEEIHAIKKEVASADGSLREYEASIEALTQLCLARVQELQAVENKRSAYREFLRQEAQMPTTEAHTPHPQSNGKPRTNGTKRPKRKRKSR